MFQGTRQMEHSFSSELMGPMNIVALKSDSMLVMEGEKWARQETVQAQRMELNLSQRRTDEWSKELIQQSWYLKAC